MAAGESLQSIAKATYGDSSLWYLIADANGLGGDRDLRVGQTLNVPSRVTGAKNNSTTFKPYNPGEVVGNTTPNLPAPPGGGGGGGCGALGSIIMIVVVVVATIYTAGAAAAYFAGSTAVVGGTAASVAAGGLAGTMSVGAAALSGSLGLSAGMAMGIGALAYGVGNLAGQIAGNAMGMQSGINWTSVATSAIGGAVTAGMGGGASGSSEFSWSNAASAMGRAAVGNAMTQTVSVALGLQKEFNWNQVAMTAVSAGASYGMSEGLGLTSNGVPARLDASDKFMRNFFGSIVTNTALTAARGGRVEVEQIATDAFGNALGNSVADAMQPEPAAGSGLKLGAGSGLGLRATDSAMAAFGRALDERIANRVWAMQEGRTSADEWIPIDEDSSLAVNRTVSGTGGDAPSLPRAVLSEGDIDRFDDGARYSKEQGQKRLRSVFGQDWTAVETKASGGAPSGGPSLTFAEDVAARKLASDPYGLKTTDTLFSSASDAFLRRNGKIYFLAGRDADGQGTYKLGDVDNKLHDRIDSSSTLTSDQLRKIFPNARPENLERYLPALNKYLPDYDVSSPERVAAFLGQVGVESNGFASTSEDLYFKTSGRLRAVYGTKLFPTLASEAPYLRNPEALANYVYANKGGNGSVSSGDGWNYRGGGLLQITLKKNYERIGDELGVDLVRNPELVRNDVDMAVRASLQYWKNNNLNRYADIGDYRSLTYNINRRLLNFEERLSTTQQALQILRQSSISR